MKSIGISSLSRKKDFSFIIDEFETYVGTGGRSECSVYLEVYTPEEATNNPSGVHADSQ